MSSLAQRFQKTDLIFRDDLTGLYNHRYYRQFFPEIASACLDEGSPLSLLLIDVDHFKGVNDTYGHQQGDRILTTVAGAISAAALGESGIPIRYAGDEFIVLFPGISRSDAVARAEKLRREAAEHPVPLAGNRTLPVTLSIGLAGHPHDADETSRLFEIADECVYISKKKGRNAVSTLDDRTARSIEKSNLSHSFPCRTFAGREAIMGRLRPFTSPAPMERRPVVALEGPFGIGKTRILRELFDGADGQRCLTFMTASYPHLTDQPFIELVDVLSSLAATHPDIAAECAKCLSPEQLMATSRFLPWLARSLPAAPPSRTGQGAGKDTVIDAFVEILHCFSRGRPIIGFFSDFQWVNHATRLVLERLKSNSRGGNAALFLDIESTGENAGELSALVGAFESAGALSREAVPPMTEEELDTMACAILPGIAGAPWALEILRQKARGLPRLLEESIKFLISVDTVSLRDGVLAIAPFTADTLPESFDAMHRPLVEGMDGDVRALLSKAAVIGDTFDLSTVKELEGLNEGHLLDILERAQKASLIAQDEGGERYRFLDRITEESLYHAIDPEERRKLHLQVATALEKLNLGNLDSVLTSLLRHFEKGEQAEKAGHYRGEYARQFGELASPGVVQLFVGRLPEAGEAWEGERALTEEEEFQAVRVARLLRMTIRNLGLFPQESEIVKGTLSGAFRELSGLLETIDVLTYSLGEGAILINGGAVSWERHKDAGEAELATLLARGNLNGVSLRIGLSAKEFGLFFELLTGDSAETIAAEGGWMRALKDRGIANIAADERVYVAMGTRNILSPSDLRKEKIVVASPGREVAAGEARLSSPLDEIPESLRRRLEELSQDLNGMEDMKAQFDVISDFLNSTLITELAALKSAAKAQAPEPQPPSTPPQAPPQPEPQIIAVTEMKPDAESHHGFSAMEEARRKLNVEALRRLDEEPELLLLELDSEDGEAVEAASTALVAKGKAALRAIVSFLKTCASPRARRRASYILFRLDGNAHLILLDELMGGTSPGEKVRLLEAMNDAQGADITGHVNLLLRSHDGEIRRAVLRLLERRAGDKVKKVLLDSLEEKDGDLLKDILHSVARLRLQQASPALARIVRMRSIFEMEPDEALQEEALRTLGHIGDTSVRPMLIENAVRSLNPFRRSKSRRVRAAAIYALGFFPDDQVRALLERTARERDPMVSSAAVLALSRMAKERAAAAPLLEKVSDESAF